MDIRSAAAICHDPFCMDRPSFRDQTLDLADRMIGAENMKNAKLEAEADVGKRFLAATYALETCAINLRAYTRGMVAGETLPAEIAKARAALDEMENSL